MWLMWLPWLPWLMWLPWLKLLTGRGAARGPARKLAFS